MEMTLFVTGPLMYTYNKIYVNNIDRNILQRNLSNER